jgi:glutamate racemase
MVVLTAFPKRKPIGVFDSGVGGLTVLKALRRELPGRDFVYIGDTARVPYGRKPREMVQAFAYGITAYLVDQGVEGVVVACNTASAAALPALSNEFDVPVWGVIEPGVEAARRATRTGVVGVIGTKGAIASGSYQKRLEAAGLRVWAKACPLFVHLVEEGLADSSEAVMLAQFYLLDRPEIDTLILGCTHYPMLRGTLQSVLGSGVNLVASDLTTAELVKHELGNGDTGEPGHITHLVTGDTLAYQHTANVIGGVEGEIRQLEITKLVALQREFAEPRAAL